MIVSEILDCCGAKPRSTGMFLLGKHLSNFVARPVLELIDFPFKELTDTSLPDLTFEMAILR